MVLPVNNVKYTLYADVGKCFRSGAHYLYIGEWLDLDKSRFVVLVHGTMSRNVYNHVCTMSRLSIYEYAPVSWVDIFPYQDNGFFRFQRIGTLYKRKDLDEWIGGLRHGQWK